MIVRESLDFERGQDPKKALGIGRSPFNHYDSINFIEWIHSRQRYEIMDLKKAVADLLEAGKVLIAMEKPGVKLDGEEAWPYFQKANALEVETCHADGMGWELHLMDTGDVYVFFEIGDSTVDPDGLTYVLTGEEKFQMKESVEFERGKDPKEAMNIGTSQSMINGLRDLWKIPGVEEVGYSYGEYGDEIVVTWDWEKYRHQQDQFDSLKHDIINHIGPYIKIKSLNTHGGDHHGNDCWSATIKPEFEEQMEDAYEKI